LLKHQEHWSFLIKIILEGNPKFLINLLFPHEFKYLTFFGNPSLLLRTCVETEASKEFTSFNCNVTTGLSRPTG